MALLGRFPSFTQLYRNAGATAVRFPWTLLSATVATVAAIVWSEAGWIGHDFAGHRLLITTVLGIPLFTALTTLAERQSWSAALKRTFPLIGVVLLALYYVTLPTDIDDPRMTLIRWLLLVIGLHLLVAFLPFLGKDQQVGFWQYNKTLFLRFLLSALYSAVVFVGLAIALLAADQLFGMDIGEYTYLDLWLAATGFFNTWLFLSWIPTDLNALNTSDSYPGGLKVFTQFILLPLVVLYFVILIAYEAKIIVTWNWPRGWVSNLVLWYSVVGILSLLLLHPLQKLAENRWITAFGRWYFRGSIPLVVLLFFAIFERVGEYGITINRYLVIALAIGLAIVVLYFVFSRVKDIRLIPIVIFVVGLISAYGPWSAFSVAESSQRERLIEYMNTHGILVDGKIQQATKTIPLEDRREMSSIIRYLDDWHGTDAFKPWIDDSTLLAWDTSSTYQLVSDSIAARMGFELMSYWETAQDGGRFYFSTDRSTHYPIEVSDYDYLYEFYYNSTSDSGFIYPFGSDSCIIDLTTDSTMITVYIGATRTDTLSTTHLDLRPRFLELREKGRRAMSDPADLNFDATSESLIVKLMIENAAGTVDSGRFEIESMRARLLVGRR